MWFVYVRGLIRDYMLGQTCLDGVDILFYFG